MTLKIEDLDEFEGLTADMVREYATKAGYGLSQAGVRAPNQGGFITFVNPMRDDAMSWLVECLAGRERRSIQSLLREINPRMRAGLPTTAEIDAHPGFWIGHMGGKYPAPTIGYFMRLIGGFEWRSGGAVWDMVALEQAAQSEYPCAFWPCDQHGNKTRRGA